eukprot:366205-Chlamydomonas_euryale.AAC.9
MPVTLASIPCHGLVQVPDVTYNFVAQNVDTFRALPLYMGALGIIGVIANRCVSRSSSCPT